MTLTERLREFEGSTDSYEWTVEVWRSDTLALANLRVRTRVYRVREHSFLWFNWTTRNEVYMNTEVASDASVRETVETERVKAREVADRFEREREAAEEIPA